MSEQDTQSDSSSVLATLDSLPEKAREAIASISNRAEHEKVKARFFGPSGELTSIIKQMGNVSKEMKPTVGKRINAVKQELETQLDEALAQVEASEMQAQLGSPQDPSLPAPDPPAGNAHPLTHVKEEIVSLFRRIGFSVAEGPEVESEWYCFDALNTPPSHPARAPQDTYYLPDQKWANIPQRENESYLLRTHTSSVQIRTLEQESPPLRIISPGRCFRRDTVDATHSSNFHQVEGLYVDKQVTIADLKATLDFFIQELLGQDARTRFRPHFFPYTEPSFEVDFHSAHLEKLGKSWVEIMGCGMVDPAVFESLGYDPDQWQGFAFGMGIERIAMILYGIDDIRYFYENDLRFLKQF